MVSDLEMRLAILITSTQFGGLFWHKCVMAQILLMLAATNNYKEVVSSFVLLSHNFKEKLEQKKPAAKQWKTQLTDSG